MWRGWLRRPLTWRSWPSTCSTALDYGRSGLLRWLPRRKIRPEEPSTSSTPTGITRIFHFAIFVILLIAVSRKAFRLHPNSGRWLWRTSSQPLLIRFISKSKSILFRLITVVCVGSFAFELKTEWVWEVGVSLRKQSRRSLAFQKHSKGSYSFRFWKRQYWYFNVYIRPLLCGVGQRDMSFIWFAPNLKTFGSASQSYEIQCKGNGKV